MAGRIPEDKIDEVRSAADIVDVISAYIPLRKRGRNFLGLCPFHNEKTPSFSVSPDRQIYHCFGCGKGGNVFSFLMEYEKSSFIDVVTSLAEKYGVALPRYEEKPDAITERLLYAHKVAVEYYQANLMKPAYRDKVNAYLFEKRGLNQASIEKFQIGLATDDWQGLVEYAAKKDLKPQELTEAGLASKSDKDGKYYDRFRMRLMIPIFNITGKIIGFGGRTLKKGEQAKYVNSPETPLYNKSFVLYGLNFAKGPIREAGSMIIVEGYFDLISLVQAGIENVVAVSGTAFTPQQARLLSRFAQKAYLFFDADSAGRSAALRSVENFFNAGIDPVIVSPPAKHDPDTFVREYGATGVLRLLDEGVSYISFRFNRVDSRALSLGEKEKVAKEIQSLAAKIDDPLRRELFLSDASDRLNLPLTTLQSQRPQADAQPKTPEKVRNINIIEAEFLSLFSARPVLIESVWNEISPDDLKGPGHAAIYSRMIKTYRDTGEIVPDRMIEQVDDPVEKSGLTLIATLEWGDLDLAEVVRDYRQMLLNQKREGQIGGLREKLAAAEKKGDRTEAEKLSHEIKYLLEKRP
jgi:DNA primase